MMNHHLPPMPHGQPPMPPPRRQHDVPYSTAPPNLRSSPAYMGYHHPHPHATGPLPPYGAPYQQHWYPYHHHMPHPPPPQSFQPYAPLIVSSHPRSQPPPPVIPPPQSIPAPSSTTSSTPLQSSFSSTPPPSTALLIHKESKANEIDNNTKLATGADVPKSPSNTPAPESSTSDNSGSTNEAAEKPIVIPSTRKPFYPPLPWLSVPGAPFPARIPRRRRKRTLEKSADPVQFATKADDSDQEKEQSAPVAAPSEPQSPVVSQAPSETGSTLPTTPSTSAALSSSRSAPAPTRASSGRPVVPVVPVLPIIPPSPSSSKRPQSGTAQPKSEQSKQESVPAENESQSSANPTQSETHPGGNLPQPAAPARPTPKSWADLVRTKTAVAGANATAAVPGAGGSSLAKNESLGDVLNSLGPDVQHYSDKVTFVEPRGLVNTGNMCYMNSILQILVFCVPFYDFLDRVGRRAVHSFRSDVPLIDAMILFMREFRVIDAASSVEQLRLRLKQNELEQYGEAFTPEYVYQVTRQLPRFRDMRRGHQQDAQEFLGFLLEELHEECVRATKTATASSSPADTDSVDVGNDAGADGWLEVGHKQKAAVTRSVGHISAESPITRIFGGKIRSEFRVPGNKISVTLEPYQSLQLDIGSPQVNNVIDALKNLTKPETMHGEFSSSRGTKVSATKQVFIESFPPVLILHLKRFHYDSATGGTQKIWKKIGYPLELNIPKEVLPPHRRNLLTAQGGVTPKYRLTGVIYHHGKNASGGHYTVDIRRQDGREWIRMDDTVLRRIRSEDVAQAGSEEDPKVLAAALERQKCAEKNSSGNMYEQFDLEDDFDQQENERGWSQVNGTSSGGHASKRSLATVVNGSATPTGASGESSGKRTPIDRFGSRDNKVAYLLFYQKIN
ncbi:hypothetical protein VTO42DRAFT_5188 [Malbranchea cinnamomea]